MNLNYGFQSIDKNDVLAVSKVLGGKWLTTGPSIEEFENKFSKIVGSKYAVAVSNGTAALHLAVLAARLPRGCEGITTPISFLATSNAMLYCGIRPVFVDIESDTYNIDADKIRNKINKNTKLIIPVHFAGQACNIKKIRDVVGDKCVIIEDAAHALGSKYSNGKMVGSCCYSNMTIFSFHPVKTITTGEGGMITTNDKKLYELLKILRSHGMTKNFKKGFVSPGPWYYEMQELGFNYRMTDFQAALGISQLSKLSNFAKKRKEIVEMYNNGFKNIEWIKIPHESQKNYSVFHIYVLQIDFKKINKSRKEVMEILSKKGIGTQVHYIPIYFQPYYKKTFGFKKGICPIAEKYYEKCLTIPLFPSMTKDEVKYVIKSVIGLYEK